LKLKSYKYMKILIRNSCLLPRTGGGVIMIAFLLICISAVTLQASDSFQKVSINKVNAKVITILEDIEDQTDYKFFYNNSQVDVDREVTFYLHEVDVNKALDELFRDTPTTYIFKENYIILSFDIDKGKRYK